MFPCKHVWSNTEEYFHVHSVWSNSNTEECFHVISLHWLASILTYKCRCNTPFIKILINMRKLFIGNRTLQIKMHIQLEVCVVQYSLKQHYCCMMFIRETTGTLLGLLLISNCSLWQIYHSFIHGVKYLQVHNCGLWHSTGIKC